MSTKDLTVKPSARGRGPAEPGAEFTNATAPAAEPAENIKKMSLEFPESVHMHLKSGAALLKMSMVDVVLQMCRARFQGAEWPADVVEQVKAQIAAQEAKEAAEKPARGRRTTRSKEA